MDEFLGSDEFAAKMAWNLIVHHGGVVDGIVPKFSANLISVIKALTMMIMEHHVFSARLLDD